VNRALIAGAAFTLLAAAVAAQEGRPPRERPPRPAAMSLPAEATRREDLSVILGRPTDRSATLNILYAQSREAYIEYGTAAGSYASKTEPVKLEARKPLEITLDKLERDRRCFYRLQSRKTGEAAYSAGSEASFRTQRAPGSTFIFGVQGDSHPERPGKMYDPELYVQTMRHVAKDAPDFYIALGDDFSIERLIERKMLSQATVDQVYAYQRSFLGLIGSSAAVFLVNGNHEQAARCNLDGTADSCAVLAGLARTRFYSLPAPDAFYGGDAEEVKHVGLPRDYYSWTWGDALFVMIDPYWHSPVAVDNEAGVQAKDDGGKKDEAKRRDLWDVTLGDAQYKWLSKTLLESKARWKFVFSHHVLGTGRGGVECASLYEWGGRNRRGDNEFAAKRPGWDMPIHQLMVKAGVNIFFQGHDHLFARQELDGIIYQSCPNPADPTYTAFNRDAYRSGDILSNSGHLRVTVSGEKVRVEYVRSCLPKDATKEHPDGEVAFAYDLSPGKPVIAPATKPAPQTIVAPGAKLVELGKDFKFTEGPVADAEGNVYFSDVHASRTYKWSPDGGAKLFRENTGSANGLAIDAAGNLLACESANGRITTINAKGEVAVVADKYDGKRFNQPNDLWIDPKGGIYFSDPIYGRADNAQAGEHVYYISPDRKKVTRVIDDMIRPNGLAGTADGKLLYVADHGAGKTYRYTIHPDGTLSDKTLFTSSGSDGMKLDGEGNVYLTTDAVVVYDPAGKQIAKIDVPQQPTNLCFAGKGRKTLFITARTGIYSIQLNVSGPLPLSQSAATSRPEGK
jgi:sugar lactone lactonase YvrE